MKMIASDCSIANELALIDCKNTTIDSKRAPKTRLPGITITGTQSQVTRKYTIADEQRAGCLKRSATETAA